MGRGKAVTEKDVEEWRAMARRIEATRAKGLTRYPRAPWEYVAEMVGRCPRVVFDYLQGAKRVERASLPLSPPCESDLPAPHTPVLQARFQGGGFSRPEDIRPEIVEIIHTFLDTRNDADPFEPTYARHVLKMLHEEHAEIMQDLGVLDTSSTL